MSSVLQRVGSMPLLGDLHERRSDRSVIWHHPAHARIWTDQVWRVLIEDAHGRHPPQTVYTRHKPFAGQDVIEEFVLSVMPPRPADLFGDELCHVEQSLIVFVICSLECSARLRGIVGTARLAAWRSVQDLRRGCFRTVVQIAQDGHFSTR